MERFNLPDDQPIQLGFISKIVGQAQAKVEGANFDLRKHLLEYDDVLNKQRGAVYKRRLEILESFDKATLADIIFASASGYLESLINQGFSLEDMPAVEGEKPSLKKIFEEARITTKQAAWPDGADAEKLKELLQKRSKEIAADPQSLGRALGILDMLWMNHLEDLEALSESVGLRAYGQRDPLVEYRGEAHRLYRDFWNNFDGWIFMNLFKLAGQGGGSAAVVRPQKQNQQISGKVGRNDPCPCGAKHPDGRPIKYKHCHGKNI